jgi:hypothetical protein
MTNAEALVLLHILQSWSRLPLAKDGRPYGPGWFDKRDWITALRQDNRRVSLRLARLDGCVRCGGALPPDSTGDHLVPLADGGPMGAHNYIPLCRSCNSSKGRRDFLVWWARSGRFVTDIPADVLASYSRLVFQAHEAAGTLDHDAPEALQRAVAVLLPLLPSNSHRSRAMRVATAMAQRASNERLERL